MNDKILSVKIWMSKESCCVKLVKLSAEINHLT